MNIAEGYLQTKTLPIRTTSRIYKVSHGRLDCDARTMRAYVVGILKKLGFSTKWLTVEGRYDDRRSVATLHIDLGYMDDDDAKWLKEIILKFWEAEGHRFGLTHKRWSIGGGTFTAATAFGDRIEIRHTHT